MSASDFDALGLYTASISTVYRRFAALQVRLGRAMAMLESAGLQRRRLTNINLPSWVPDWTAQGTSPKSISSLRPEPFTASSTAEPYVQLLGHYGSQGLSVRGLIVDTIDTVTHVHSAPLIPNTNQPDFLAFHDRFRSAFDHYVRQGRSRYHHSEAAFATVLIVDDMYTGRNAITYSSPITDIVGTYRAAVTAWRNRTDYRSGFSGQKLDAVQTFQFQAAAAVPGRGFATTTAGYIGLVPPQAQEGDVVAVLFGAAVPYVLRKRPQNEGGGFVLVGDAFVHGLMYGGALEKRDLSPVDVVIHSFWDKYITKTPGKVTTIFPPSLYSSLLPRPSTFTKNDTTASPTTTNFGSSYTAAAEACRAKIARIVRDCRRTNSKFTDPDFDLRGNQWDCLLGLNWRFPPTKGNPAAIENALGTLEQMQVFDGTDCLQLTVPMLRKIMGRKVLDEEQEGNNKIEYDPDPKAVHRVGWIFEDPKFEVDGFSSSDIMQGSNSMDCWWLSAVATICHRRELMDKICVARDEECGVYGFVFYRDGGWVYTVVDDHLFLTNADYEGGGHDPSNAIAYAKARGDYHAIWGGLVGEGVEDLTGGVNSELALEDVLFKEHLWRELVNENGDFVFGLDILDRNGSDKNGLANAHAYALLAAREEVGEDGKVIRLVKIRNPWGERGGDGMGEWTGPWSDGSKEWTPYWLTKLDYRFEDDGVFWMTYSDMLHTFTNLYRTRLFDDKWAVAQEWTNVNLDTRYFNGLEGEYSFLLHFILQKQGAEPGDYLCRVRPQAENFFRANRSINCEIDLEPGIYEVLPKITAERDTSKPAVENIVKFSAQRRPEKLRQVGLSFDLAHAKAFKVEKKEGDGWETEPEDEEEEKASATDTDEETPEGSGEGQDAAGPGEGQQSAQGEEEDDDDEDDDEDHPSPWNAVAVIGLRVYSQDPDLAIKLAEPSSDEEAASVVRGT
ncbi:hypothetical protein B0T21DRAFT_416338 [Apiosordaria backusii]|uniref:Calpain catalytic domain-containing protein n=1 Tax=Apiosordaria backusii TaxID=314023 RepID=A0AA40A175_9PEZI|nr:hypothetical protein B0T21DRAFT_416338 [Apiosordaria backusii]